ncbi:hypothetical protein Bhyg_13088, partial [Pseudolycoriella hygida]
EDFVTFKDNSRKPFKNRPGNADVTPVRTTQLLVVSKEMETRTSGQSLRNNEVFIQRQDSKIAILSANVILGQLKTKENIMSIVEMNQYLVYYKEDEAQVLDYSVVANQILNGTFNGKILVVVNNIYMEYIKLAQEILNQFFYDYIVNVNLLIPNPSNSEQVFMFTYYPYRPQLCSKCNLELHNVFEKEVFLYEKPHFPNKLQNFYNCTIVVATFNTPPYVSLVTDKNGKQNLLGFEGSLFNKMAEILNLSIEIIVPRLKWGSMYENNTFTGAFELIQKNKANVTFGSFFYRHLDGDYFDFTRSYYTSYMCVLIPSGRPITSLEKTLWPFRKEVWYTVLFIVACKILIQIPIKTLSLNRHLDYINVLDFVRIYLGFSIIHCPVKLLSKFFVIGMFFYALTLRSSYQSSLFHFMTLKLNVSAVLRVSELIEEDFTFQLVEPLRFVLDSVPHIKSRATVIPMENERLLLKHIPHDWETKIAIITTRDHFRGKMIAIQETIYQISVTMILRKNSYFTEVFNEVIYKLLTNGYITHAYLHFKEKRNQPKISSKLLALNDVVGLF